MNIGMGDIQPVAGFHWVAPALKRKAARSVAPVTKTEGGKAAKFRADYSGSCSYLPLSDSGFSSEVVQIESFLKENIGIEIKFAAGSDGRSVVQGLSNNPGKTIGWIPLGKSVLFRDKMEDFRDTLFDSKALGLVVK